MWENYNGVKETNPALKQKAAGSINPAAYVYHCK
jgi:hypothetical protein